MSYYAGKFFEELKRELMTWVWNNSKLLHKITQYDLQYLFEFHPNRGLSIDLRRFEPEYYKEVFYPPEAKKANIDEFVRKVCIVLAAGLKRSGRSDLTITITVRHMVSESSHWKTFFMDEKFDSRVLKPLSSKEEDWYYAYKRTD
ncbi:hypothetical protein [Mucilaginibacter myungsuensis]|uniref:Uncharacterized protein n=1 Tax=Mucilaginibacter myungsuensis TaxID=649104 RepID=A0A929L4K5_9SPHI|nr:hypothetical protein [Mucilaginibacter myungsuensis]MBE9663121.1 hypothetical protein [Mucilaginibacter myungsuensis]MDN3598756.1 hypothetical protein [Mucilaginibacter myungsuensis]